MVGDQAHKATSHENPRISKRSVLIALVVLVALITPAYFLQRRADASVDTIKPAKPAKISITTTTLPTFTVSEPLPQTRDDPYYKYQLAILAQDHYDEFTRIAQCETGSRWTMRGSRSSGGLGLLTATWNQYRWPQMPANMADATEDEQRVIALRVFYEAGRGTYSPWGCKP